MTLQTIAAKKITKATFKAFINANKPNLFILRKTDFDPMTDGLTSIANVPHKIEIEPSLHLHDTTLGIKDVWLVGGGRDYFKAYEDEMFKGIECVNCCGRFILAVIK